jgi:VCBS repeat-containing protein
VLVLGNDTDADGNSTINPASVVVIQNPANGSVVVNADGTISYTSNGAEVTADSFTYTVNDTDGATSNTATVAITITPVNDAPINGSYTPQPPNQSPNPTSGAVSGTVTATDPENGALTYSGNVVTSKGTVVVNSNGTFTYTPTAAAMHNASATSATNADKMDAFTVTVTDAQGGTLAVPITINILPKNAAPTATTVNRNFANTVQHGSVTATDPDGDALTYAVTVAATQGAASIDQTTGAWTYIANPAARDAAAATPGTQFDTFSYTVNDGHGQIITRTATVEVMPTGVLSEIRQALSTQLSPDGTRVVTAKEVEYGAGRTGTEYTVFRTSDGAVVGQVTLEGEAGYNFQFTPDGTGAVVTPQYQSAAGPVINVAVIDLMNGTLRGSALLNRGGGDTIYHRFTPDGKTAIVVVETFDPTGQASPTADYVVISPTTTSTFRINGYSGGGGAPLPVITANGTRAVVAYFNQNYSKGNVAVVDLSAGTVLSSTQFDAAPEQIELNADGTRAVVTLSSLSGSAKTIAVFNTTAGGVVANPVTVNGFVEGLKFNANRTRAVFTVMDNFAPGGPAARLVIVDTATGAVAGGAPLAFAGGSLGAADFSADGTKVVYANSVPGLAQTKITLINATTGATVGTPTTVNGSAIYDAVFSPNHSVAVVTVVGALANQTRVYKFDTSTGQQIGTVAEIAGLPPNAQSLIFAPDSSRFFIFTRSEFATADPNVVDVSGRVTTIPVTGGLVIGRGVFVGSEDKGSSSSVFQIANNNRAILVYTAGDGGAATTRTRRISVFNTATGSEVGTTQSFSAGPNNFTPQLSSNGAAAAVLTSLPQPNGTRTDELRIVNLATGSVTLRQISGLGATDNVKYELTPDGSRVVIAVQRIVAGAYVTHVEIIDVATGAIEVQADISGRASVEYTSSGPRYLVDGSRDRLLSVPTAV